ncbi:MAG: AAA-like domain-containing protein [Phormidium sp.]
MEIIHLSDLHFGTEENARLWSSQLVQDVRREMNLSTIDALILSGDIANKATEAEYKAAQLFLDELKKEFNLQPNQIIIVPGNHDIDRNPVTKAYKNNYQGELKEGFGQGYYRKQIKNLGEYSLTSEYKSRTEEFIKLKQKQSDKDKDSFFLVRHEETYKQRFKNFSDFYQYIKGEPYPLEDKEQGILNYFPEQKLLIVGFNSAWQINHIDPDHLNDANINNDPITKVLNEIELRDYQDWVKIAVWHHPLHSPFEDRIKDDSFMQRLSQSGFCFVIHGHIHNADESPYHRPYEGRIRFIPAGTFGAPVRQWVPGYPLQYNRLKLTRDKLTIYTRRREQLNGVWKPDARWNTQGGKFSDSYIYELPQHLRSKRSSISKPFVPPQPLGVYVERRAPGDSQSLEEKCYEAIKQRGMIIRIKGPEKMGKSMLMEKIFQKAEEAQYQRVLLPFGEPTYEVISSYDKFLLWFCQRTTKELNLPEIDAKKYWETENEFDLNTKCGDYFYEQILPKIDENSALVLGLHRVDRIFPLTFASDFFSMLRAWYDSKGPWGKLRLVLAHSTECYVKMDVDKSPFNVGEPIMLDEFDYEQVKELTAQYTAPIDDKNIKSLMLQIGGHPYLLSKLIPDIKNNPQKYKEDDFIQPITKVCKPYLDSLWNQLNEPSELSQAMRQALKDLLEGKQLSEVGDKKVLFLLESIGLVIEDINGHKTIRNNLYREYLKNKLYP